ncbi:sigma-70 family RNA polymerase sigma factor [Actinokineospora auranticolor]|uniref:RNA polymerase sigma-70 factor (Sigma-E family) n=1 Tax=Actinokineospora auranticolor TaxID=155976 RepID=A0A2S6GWA1_9PSEU|nr:sigma-70 family RNA polymerase sigma factor [Actinokineospora auranticolor]PPK69489.1 RNA polymerase sigma-70 factor (sigma-E family) [Actinokineospora auranticolor]
MRGGDAGFDEFVRERYDQLLRYAIMLTGRRWDAEEIVQEALLRCLRRWRRVPADNAVAYVRKAIYHEFLRVARRKPQVPLDELAEQLDLEDFAPAVVARDHVLVVLQQLPPRQRAAVLARVVLDLSEAQTAVELDCSVGTVKSLTSRGMARIRQLWAAEQAAAPGRRGT